MSQIARQFPDEPERWNPFAGMPKTRAAREDADYKRLAAIQGSERSVFGVEPTNERVIKTYVWHADQCYFVSTIERTSSAAANPCRFNETLVWRYDWGKSTRGQMVHQAEAPAGSIVAHQRTVEAIHDVGERAFE